MTIPRRTDASAGENFAARRPTVLAELPHVGEPASNQHFRKPIEPVDPPTRNPKSKHPAFAEHADAHEDNSFEDEQRRRNGTRRQARYVDQSHIERERERRTPINHDHDKDEHYEPRERLSGHVVHRQASLRPTAEGRGRWSAVLSTAHAQLAPFAGLIVTAALIASAGLLFLMMTGNKETNAQFDELALPGFRVDASRELEQADSDESAIFADADLVERQSEESTFSQPAQSEPQTLPTRKSTANSSAAIPQPVIEEIVEPTTPLGSLTFPVTSTPLALDYRKAISQPTDELQALPAVAERGNLPETQPINR